MDLQGNRSHSVFARLNKRMRFEALILLAELDACLIMTGSLFNWNLGLLMGIQAPGKPLVVGDPWGSIRFHEPFVGHLRKPGMRIWSCIPRWRLRGSMRQHAHTNGFNGWVLCFRNLKKSLLVKIVKHMASPHESNQATHGYTWLHYWSARLISHDFTISQYFHPKRGHWGAAVHGHPDVSWANSWYKGYGHGMDQPGTVTSKI